MDGPPAQKNFQEYFPGISKDLVGAKFRID